VEGRKVQRVGHSTLAVSLPHEWVKEVGLRQGDLLMCNPEKDGALRLVPGSMAQRKAEVRECLINSDLCDESGMLERIVVGNYVLGREIIRVVSAKRIKGEHLDEIRRTVRRLMGLGIIEETPTQVALQCSIDPVKFPIHMAMRRLYVIASTMHKEAIQALTERDLKLADETVRREEEADMIYWLIIRLASVAQQDKALARELGLEESMQILSSRVLVHFLERIGDWGELIAKNVLEIGAYGTKIKPLVIDSISQLSDLAQAVCHKAMDCFFTGDVLLANSAIETYKKIIETKEEKLIQEISTEVPDAAVCMRLRAVIWGIRRIAELGAEVAEITIDRALERPSKICETY